jgi:uncharacterized membrane protein YhaH (DUF805 family)
MTKPRLAKVRALFYVLQQVRKRGCAYFDTAPIALYFFILFVVGLTLGATGYYQEYSKTELYMFSIGCMIPSVYIAIAAGVKRTHDTRVSSWYSLVPLIPLFFLNVVTFVIFCAGCIFLFKDAGEDGINEHGSNPTQSYEEQLNIEKMY